MLWDYIALPHLAVNSKMECLRKYPYFQWYRRLNMTGMFWGCIISAHHMAIWNKLSFTKNLNIFSYII